MHVAKKAESCKIFFFGESGVGKTALIMKIPGEKHSFNRSYQPTVGVDIKTSLIKRDNTPLVLVLWDILWREKDIFLRSSAKDADLAILMFDLTRQETFESIKPVVKEIQDHRKKTVILIIGNKKDLQEKRKVEKKIVSDFVKTVGCEYFEISVETEENLNPLLDKILSLSNTQ